MHPIETFTVACPPDPYGDYDLPRGSVRFVDAPGSPRVNVEVARTNAHRERGLMYRRTLAKDAGMLFSWRNSEQRAMWMKNTCIAFDMVFIGADNRVVGIIPDVPPANERLRSVFAPAKHVLEINAGWARDHGVRVGQRVVIEVAS